MTCREQLFHLLAEAAELEHNILCSYLYAIYSLKQEEAEDLRAAEREAVMRWRGMLMELCIEEMVHLAQVANLLVSTGARPHFDRPNLPVAPGYHPAGIVIRLAPLDLETLDHFIYLERPEEAPVTDSAAFASDAVAPARPAAPAASLMPRAPEYATIGAFYLRLRETLQQLAQGPDGDRLFNGPVELQMHPDELQAPELVVVKDLASALAAIDFIVVQGEGSPGHGETTHFERFQAIRTEYLQLQKARPGFVPHRPVARDPVMHPPQGTGRVHVTGMQAAPLLDAANATYSALLRCLAQLYEVPAARHAERRALLGAAVAAMKVLSGLGVALTALPAQDEPGAPHAGVSFAVLRSTEGLMPDAAAGVLAERLRQIAGHLPQTALGDNAGALAAQLEAAAAGIGRANGEGSASTIGAAH